jgi:hypothetical protein
VASLAYNNIDLQVSSLLVWHGQVWFRCWIVWTVGIAVPVTIGWSAESNEGLSVKWLLSRAGEALSYLIPGHPGIYNPIDGTSPYIRIA